MSAPRVALVHDWLTNQGGGERVLWTLHEAFPEAHIYTSVFEPGALPQFKELDVRTSFLQQIPLARQKHQLFPMLRTLAFESFDFKGYDLVISSCSAEAKGIITDTHTKHISYIHTPTRYYWSDYDRYLRDPGFGVLDPLVRQVMPLAVKRARRWDYAAAQRPDALVANSKFVAERIKRYYDRESTVIHPPIDLARFEVKKGEGKYYLVASRLVPYKRIELAVLAAKELELPLVVVGDGSEKRRLERLAGPETKFVGRVTDAEMVQYYQGAKALLFPGEEDFGMIPLEVQACGRPVIAFGRGGACETVVEGKTGLFFNAPSVGSLVHTINKFEKLNFDPHDCRAQAERFSAERFIDEVKTLAEKLLN